MITTADISKETGLKQRTIQKRIKQLGLKVQYAGATIVMSPAQAEQIKAFDSKPGPRGPRK